MEEMMRRTDTAVVFPQPHPDSTTAVPKKAARGKAKKQLQAKGRWSEMAYRPVKKSSIAPLS